MLFINRNAVLKCGLIVAIGLIQTTLFAQTTAEETAQTDTETGIENAPGKPPLPMAPMVIVGTAEDVEEVTGGATVLDPEDLERLNYTDVQRVLRQIPGISLQFEDGYGLRPNISIRGTATERSSRITLLEDGVLIAPAPYSAPAAYYFPNIGRIYGVEVLKGPAAITQGPYTVGGALNLISTPIPEEYGGQIEAEGGSDGTFRFHGYYGGREKYTSFSVETLQYTSDGYLDLDRDLNNSGFDIQDYVVKLGVNTDRKKDGTYHEVQLKLQYGEQDSNFSYLGLTDNDFAASPQRRYGLSELDNIETEHSQVQLTYVADFDNAWSLNVTGYYNDFSRNWFKTEGIDFDGSPNAQDFSRTSWFNVINAINNGQGLGDLSVDDLQAILDGTQDTAAGAIQVRANDRDYYSAGVQAHLNGQFTTGPLFHDVTFSVRYHEDEEDRLQRNSTYTQINGELVLDDLGLLGNAGNRIQSAQAFSAYVYDKIEIGDRWIITPGLRFESIDQDRTRYETRAGRTDNPALRTEDNLRGTRENNTDDIIPGVGALYRITDNLSAIAGIHEGFTAPTNAPGVDPEESLNLEYGFRYNNGWLYADVIGFYTDYENLLGVCTNSSGVDCEAGDAFNGNAASVTGVEVLVTSDWSTSAYFSLPFRINYTFIDAEFDSDIADTEFFGDVSAGDPLPYIPEHQFNIQQGIAIKNWELTVSALYVDSVCVQSPCTEFLRTDDTLVFDAITQYSISDRAQVYFRVENLFDSDDILGRQPYGARGNKDRSYIAGLRLFL